MTQQNKNIPLSDFDYDYPDELVAQRPLPSRDDSRMMVLDRKDKSINHSKVTEFASLLKKGDLVVVNNSKVIPARIFGKKSNGDDVEILVVEKHNELPQVWRCLTKRAKRVRKGDKFFFGMQSTATAMHMEGSFLLIEFKNNALALAIKYHGVPPLPPYIEREGFKAYTEEDRERYQTIYAEKTGSAAAPTAGLHLSEKIISDIKTAGAEMVGVTLHVGIDTFAPVRVENTADHKMHGEEVEITEEVALKISAAKKEGRRVIAIGTTSVRALESAAIGQMPGNVRSGKWTTEMFITEGYEFKIVSAMLTNFHQPRSTLIMLVSAFAGREFILDAYKTAIEDKYRLFSYGDCMFIL